MNDKPMLSLKKKPKRTPLDLVQHIVERSGNEDYIVIIYHDNWPEIADVNFRLEFALEFENQFGNEYEFSPPDMYDSWTLSIYMNKRREVNVSNR